MQNNVLYLQPINYYTLQDELCFFVGDRVRDRFADEIEEFMQELMIMECLTVCRHITKDSASDYYEMMTQSHLFYANRSSNNNFAISSIRSGREFQARKKYLYSQGVFLIHVTNGASIVINHQKHTSCETLNNNWGMTPDAMNALCDSMDDYFFNDNHHNENKVDITFEKQILMPLTNYTHYEDLAEQIDAYGNNYIVYDKRNNGNGKARRKVYTFFSFSFDPDELQYQVGDRVAVETTENINDEIKRKVNGTIVGRNILDDSVALKLEFFEQFDDNLLPETNGHIFLQVNETQKRVRENVIKKIVNGTVESKYMYRLFSKFKPAGYECQEGWEDFYKELLAEQYPPNKSQMEAIRRGIETKDIQLVLGPPGTGKTTVIVSWIKYFIKHGKRVLVSSQNNSAVDNVLERIGKNKDARVIRIGDIEKIQENCKQYSTEMQVDATAELYLQRIQNNKEVLSSDIEKLTATIDFIDEIYTDYEKLEQLKNSIYEYAKKFESTQQQLLELYEKVIIAKKGYEDIYNSFLHKTIALHVANHKNTLWKLIHRRHTKRLVIERKKIETELDDTIEVYTNSIRVYNQNVDKFGEMLKESEYMSLKSVLREQKKKCAGYSLQIELDGPIPSPQIAKEDEKGENQHAKDNVKIYQAKLQNIKGQLEAITTALSDWELAVNKKRNEIVTNLLIQNSNVVGATCIGINTRRQFQNLNFDVSIIDESGQIQIHNAIVPMSRAPKTLMLGDHLQIPPMTNDTVVNLCKQDGIKTDLLEMSFFEFLFKKLEGKDANVPNLTRLDEQFRMPGNISDVISDWFYEGNYHAHYDMSKWKPVVEGTKTPLILISTSNMENRFEQGPNNSADSTPGYSNPLEAEIIAKIISKVFRDAEDLISECVGVISAYGKQVRLIRQKISELKIGFNPEQIYSMVASLDSFQGQERPLIIYSSTRSTKHKKPSQARVGFMKELRRLNVAFTRCQKQLVIIGDFDYLTTCEYEELDPESGEPLPNKSEKKYAEFMRRMVEQAKSERGEYYELSDFYEKVGI